MKHRICAVFDAKAQMYNRPIFVPHLGIAIRAFADEINNPENRTMYDHPGDFNLYHLGTFDDESGTIDPCLPHQIAAGDTMTKRDFSTKNVLQGN